MCAALGFGTISILQASTSSFAGIMTCRAFLGMFEAAFAPGIPLYLVSLSHIRSNTVLTCVVVLLQPKRNGPSLWPLHIVCSPRKLLRLSTCLWLTASPHIYSRLATPVHRRRLSYHSSRYCRTIRLARITQASEVLDSRAVNMKIIQE